MLAAGTSFPRSRFSTGFSGENFQMVVHFERKDAGSAAKLGEIVEGCLEIAGAEL